MTRPLNDPPRMGEGRRNKLLRVSGPRTYRLMAVEMHGERWIGETRGGDTLKDDIASYRDRRAVCKPLYAVFVRPKSPPLTPSILLCER